MAENNKNGYIAGGYFTPIAFKTYKWSDMGPYLQLVFGPTFHPFLSGCVGYDLQLIQGSKNHSWNHLPGR